MSDSASYYVIPLTVQKEGDVYLVGNADIGEFYQFPEEGLGILNMLKAGSSAATIKSRLAAESSETLDVDDLIEQLLDMGYIYPQEQKHQFLERAAAEKRTGRRFSIDARVARAIFSPVGLLIYALIVGYALLRAIDQPALRVDWLAFYTETNRTALFLLILVTSIVAAVLHELGHMLAAARWGISSKYGVSNRLWAVVAETDLTGIMSLPKAQRYLPLFAGILVDTLNIAVLTLLIGSMIRHDSNAFAIKVAQALVLQLVISITWQFNIFVRTDIYYVLCTYFSYPDLDKDARHYLQNLIHQLSFGRLGAAAAPMVYKNLGVLRAFAVIWVLGRVFSLFILFFVALPTLAEYFISAYHSLYGPPGSVWIAYDTGLFAVLSLSTMGIGIYMWLRQKQVNTLKIGEASDHRAQ